ncbi:hypothetical protein COU48_01045, partial [Candidatus Nomurabacteria bacterium CG10_big_fil_rev_8_21_14_0_10_03_31_7]
FSNISEAPKKTKQYLFCILQIISFAASFNIESFPKLYFTSGLDEVKNFIIDPSGICLEYVFIIVAVIFVVKLFSSVVLSAYRLPTIGLASAKLLLKGINRLNINISRYVRDIIFLNVFFCILF